MTTQTRPADVLIIGVGLMRTGGESLQVALTRLLNVESRRLAPNISFWQTAIAGDRSDREWRDFCARNRILVSLPSSVLYKRLLEVNPKAKVILTIRDPRRWFRSVHSTLLPFAESLRVFPMSVIARISGTAANVSLFNKVASRVLGKDCDIYDESQMVDAFERHVTEVKQSVPAAQLLVYDVKDGWSPLCEFLGVPQPLEAFPHVNQTYEFRRWARRRVRYELAVTLIGVIILTWGLYRLVRHMTSSWTYYSISVNHDEV